MDAFAHGTTHGVDACLLRGRRLHGTRTAPPWGHLHLLPTPASAPRPAPTQVSERFGGSLDAMLAALAAHGAPERLRAQLAATAAGLRLAAGGRIEGREGGEYYDELEDDLDSADAADMDELLGMVPTIPEGGMPFTSTGSTPD